MKVNREEIKKKHPHITDEQITEYERNMSKYSDYSIAVWKARSEYPKTRVKLDIILSKSDREEKRIQRHRLEIDEREFVIQYLKDNYPNSGFAEKHAELNKWNLPLRNHTCESLNCSYLNEDKHHCNKIHESDCYTCCFECYHPVLCEFNSCELLK